MRFTIPPQVEKVSPVEASKLELDNQLFPIGTLFRVKSTGTYFRFLTSTSRSGTSHSISTEKGFLCRKFGSTELYMAFDTDNVARYDHKNDAVEALLKHLG